MCALCRASVRAGVCVCAMPELSWTYGPRWLLKGFAFCARCIRRGFSPRPPYAVRRSFPIFFFGRRFFFFHGISCHCHTIAARCVCAHIFLFLPGHDERMHFVHDCNQKWHWNFQTQMSLLVFGPRVAFKTFQNEICRSRRTRLRSGGGKVNWLLLLGRRAWSWRVNVIHIVTIRNVSRNCDSVNAVIASASLLLGMDDSSSFDFG